MMNPSVPVGIDRLRASRDPSLRDPLNSRERVFLQEPIHLTLIRIDYIVSPFPNTPNRAAKDIMKKFISSRGALRSDLRQKPIPKENRERS
ncbi:hypothetical protein Tco_0175022 [Tanacetum coccineum]